MLIGELAKALGVSTKTLRHYESIGLVAEPGRTGNTYRVYTPAAVARARLVVGLRAMGLSIEQIQVLLASDVDSFRQRLLGLLDQQLQDYALQIAVLQGRHDDLDARYRALLDAAPGTAGNCVCAVLLQSCTCASSASEQSSTLKSSNLKFVK